MWKKIQLIAIFLLTHLIVSSYGAAMLPTADEIESHHHSRQTIHQLRELMGLHPGEDIVAGLRTILESVGGDAANLRAKLAALKDILGGDAEESLITTAENLKVLINGAP